MCYENTIYTATYKIVMIAQAYTVDITQIIRIIIMIYVHKNVISYNYTTCILEYDIVLINSSMVGGSCMACGLSEILGSV